MTVVGLAATLVISAPVLHLRLGFDDASNGPSSSTTYKSYEMLAQGFGPGFNGPLFLVAQVQSPADRAALDRLDHALTAVPGVAAVQTPPAPTTPGTGPAIEVTQVLPDDRAPGPRHLHPDQPLARLGAAAATRTAPRCMSTSAA